MSGEAEAAPTGSERVPAPATRTVPAVRREGGRCHWFSRSRRAALGALAVGAVAIGKLAIGQLALGRARLRRGQVEDLHIARLTVGELRVERVR